MVILFDIFHMPDDIFSVVFATEQQVIVSKMLIKAIKERNGSMGKTEMSIFANNLHDGINVETEVTVGPIKKTESVKISYNKRQFYDRILTPMRSMGMIDYDLYKKKYILSDKLIEELSKIGMLWKKEVVGPSGNSP